MVKLARIGKMTGLIITISIVGVLIYGALREIYEALKDLTDTSKRKK